MKHLSILLFCLLSGISHSAGSKPSVIIILNESARADSFKSPVLDSIAAKGVRFRFVWSAADTETSGQMLKSGYYPFRAESKNDSLKSLGYQHATIEQVSSGKAKAPFLVYHVLKGASVEALDIFIKPLADLENTLLIVSSLKGSAGDAATQINSNASVPMIISGPPVLAPGRECWDLIDFTDFYPTLAAISGIDLKGKIDGKSFLPSLQNSDDPFLKRNWIYSETAGNWMIRDWQNVLHRDGRFTKIAANHLSTEKIKKTDKIAPHRRQRLEMLVDRLRGKE